MPLTLDELQQKQSSYKNAKTTPDATKFKTYLQDALDGVVLPPTFAACLVAENMPFIILSDISNDAALLAEFFKILETQPTITFPEKFDVKLYTKTFVIAKLTGHKKVAQALKAAGAVDNAPLELTEVFEPGKFAEFAQQQQKDPVALFLQLLELQHKNFADRPAAIARKIEDFIEQFPRHTEAICQQVHEQVREDSACSILDRWLYNALLHPGLNNFAHSYGGYHAFAAFTELETNLGGWFDGKRALSFDKVELARAISIAYSHDEPRPSVAKERYESLFKKINDPDLIWAIILECGSSALKPFALQFVENFLVKVYVGLNSNTYFCQYFGEFHVALSFENTQLMANEVARHPKKSLKKLKALLTKYTAENFHENPHYHFFEELSRAKLSCDSSSKAKDKQNKLSEFYDLLNQYINNKQKPAINIDDTFFDDLAIQTPNKAKQRLVRALQIDTATVKKELTTWLQSPTAQPRPRVPQLLVLLSQPETRQILFARFIKNHDKHVAQLLHFHNDTAAAKEILFGIAKNQPLESNTLLNFWATKISFPPDFQADFYFMLATQDLTRLDDLLLKHPTKTNEQLAPIRTAVANDPRHPYGGLIKKVEQQQPTARQRYPQYKNFFIPVDGALGMLKKALNDFMVSQVTQPSFLISTRAVEKYSDSPVLEAPAYSSQAPGDSISHTGSVLKSILLFLPDDHALLTEFFDTFGWDWGEVQRDLADLTTLIKQCKQWRIQTRTAFYKTNPTPTAKDWEEYLQDAALGVELPPEYVQCLAPAAKALLEYFPFNNKIGLAELLFIAGQESCFDVATKLLSIIPDPESAKPYIISLFEGVFGLPVGTLQPHVLNSAAQQATLNNLVSDPNAFLDKLDTFAQRYPQHLETIKTKLIATIGTDLIILSPNTRYKLFFLLLFATQTRRRFEHRCDFVINGNLHQVQLVQQNFYEQTAQEKLFAVWLSTLAKRIDCLHLIEFLHCLSCFKSAVVKDVVTCLSEEIQTPQLIWAAVCTGSFSLPSLFKNPAQRFIEQNQVDLQACVAKWNWPLAKARKFLGDFHYALATEDVEMMVAFMVANPNKSYRLLASIYDTIPLKVNPHKEFFFKVHQACFKKEKFFEPQSKEKENAINKLFRAYFRVVVKDEQEKKSISLLEFPIETLDVCYQEVAYRILEENNSNATVACILYAYSHTHSRQYQIGFSEVLLSNTSQQTADAIIKLKVGNSHTFMRFLLGENIDENLIISLLKKASPMHVCQAVSLEGQVFRAVALAVRGNEVFSLIQEKINSWREDLKHIFKKLAQAPSLAAAKTLVQENFQADPEFFKQTLRDWLQTPDSQPHPTTQQLRALISEPALTQIIEDELVRRQDVHVIPLLRFYGETTFADRIVQHLILAGAFNSTAPTTSKKTSAAQTVLCRQMHKAKLTGEQLTAEINTTVGTKDTTALKTLFLINYEETDLRTGLILAQEANAQSTSTATTTSSLTVISNAKKQADEVFGFFDALEKDKDLNNYLKKPEPFFKEVLFIKSQKGLLPLEILLKKDNAATFSALLAQQPNAVIHFLANHSLSRRIFIGIMGGVGLFRTEDFTCPYTCAAQLLRATVSSEIIAPLLEQIYTLLLTKNIAMASSIQMHELSPREVLAFIDALLTLSLAPEADSDHYIEYFNTINFPDYERSTKINTLHKALMLGAKVQHPVYQYLLSGLIEKEKDFFAALTKKNFRAMMTVIDSYNSKQEIKFFKELVATTLTIFTEPPYKEILEQTQQVLALGATRNLGDNQSTLHYAQKKGKQKTTDTNNDENPFASCYEL